MKTICKFKCETVTFREDTADISMSAVTQDAPENKEFFKWTPSGAFTMQVVKHETANQFVPGREYYITIEDMRDD